MEYEDFYIGSGQQHESALVGADTVEAKVGFIDKTVPHAAIVGHQLICDTVGELIHIGAGFQNT